MITVTLLGKEQLIAKLGNISDALRPEVLKSTQLLAIQLQAYVKEKKLSGQVLKNRSDHLRASINQQVIDDGTIITGIVGTNVEYAAIHEYGGTTKPHIIEPRNVAALHFMMNGKDVFCKRVNHPGSVMPERSFLRSSLKELMPTIQTEYNAAAARAIKT